MLLTKLNPQEESILSSVSFSAPYYKISYKEKCSDYFYNQLLNWFEGEFDLYFYEQIQNTLKIYHPNGYTLISLNINKEIILEAKNKNSLSCKKMMLKIIRSYQLFKKIKSPNLLISKTQKETA